LVLAKCSDYGDQLSISKPDSTWTPRPTPCDKDKSAESALGENRATPLIADTNEESAIQQQSSSLLLANHDQVKEEVAPPLLSFRQIQVPKVGTDHPRLLYLNIDSRRVPPLPKALSEWSERITSARQFVDKALENDRQHALSDNRRIIAENLACRHTRAKGFSRPTELSLSNETYFSRRDRGKAIKTTFQCFASVIPKVSTFPGSTVSISLHKNLSVADEPLLGFVPFFDNDDQEDVLADVYEPRDVLTQVEFIFTYMDGSTVNRH